MDAVKITIDSTMLGASEERYQFIAYGRMQEKMGTFYVRYDETEATGMLGTKTTLKWDQKALTVIRHGSYDHCQEHSKGKVSRSIYKTPYFTLPLETTTTHFLVKQERGAWFLEVEYEVTLDGAAQGKVKLLISIEEDKISGH